MLEKNFKLKIVRKILCFVSRLKYMILLKSGSRAGLDTPSRELTTVSVNRLWNEIYKEREDPADPT